MFRCVYPGLQLCCLIFRGTTLKGETIGVSSEQESPKSRVAGLVAGPPSLICGELHHPSGLQGQRFFRCRIGFTARWVVRTTWRNWRKQGFPTCKRREARASRQTRLRAHANAGSFREFRMERSGILEAMTLVSPVGMGRSKPSC